MNLNSLDKTSLNETAKRLKMAISTDEKEIERMESINTYFIFNGTYEGCNLLSFSEIEALENDQWRNGANPPFTTLYVKQRLKENQDKLRYVEGQLKKRGEPEREPER